MTRDVPRLAAALLFASALATCCPSIWFTVTKGDPGARPWLPRPKVADPPILKPTLVDNRFDVLGSKERLYPSYTDEVTRDEDRFRVVTAAIQDLRALQAELGRPGGPVLELMPDPSPELDAIVRCGGPRDCRMLEVAAEIRLPAALYARIGTGVYMVRACQSLRKPPALTPCMLDELPDRQGVMIELTEEVTLTAGVKAKWGEPVRVRFSEHLTLSETLLSFVHLSDIQLRDPAVTLTDPDLSRRLDWLIPSFEYDHDQAFYSRHVLEALFATINAEVARDTADERTRPAFVMHTGDSIDSGLRSELVELHPIIDDLSIPFYNAIGNHDVLVFGNLLPSATRQDDAPCVEARSLASHYNAYFRQQRRVLPNKLCVDKEVACKNCLGREASFVAGGTIAESRKAFIAGFTDARTQAQARPPSHKDDWSCSASPDVALDWQKVSFAHGLDLNHAKGYYAFARRIEIGGEARHVLIVVLDSEDLPDHTGGAGGRVGPAQLAWLKNVLSCAAPQDLVFVFSHHPMSGMATDTPGELEQILGASKNVIAHFYGHKHQHGLCRDPRPGVCSKFWEIETGSLIEFPQEARMVRLKYAGHGLAYFDLVTFGERLEPREDEFTRAVALGRRGAERDYCHTHRDEVECSDDLRVFRTDGRHSNARLFFRLPELR